MVDTERLAVEELAAFSLATVQARKGKSEALSQAALAAFGVTPPDGPRMASKGKTGFVGVGPGRWLAFERAVDARWEQRLRDALGETASVCDQSGGYVVFRLSGPAARKVLSKGAFLDLHPDVFKPGCAASTVIAHLGVTLWRAPSDVFEVLVFRSFAGAFRHWLAAAAAEYGA